MKSSMFYLSFPLYIGGVIAAVVCRDLFIINEKVPPKCQAVFPSLRPVLQLKRFRVERHLVVPDSLNKPCEVPIPSSLDPASVIQKTCFPF